jgi:hypothetical protein
MLVSLNAIAQRFVLPDIPMYDSVFIDSYENKIEKKGV